MYYSCTTDYQFKKEREGGFIPDSSAENLSKENRLINCSMIFYEKTDNINVLNRSYFMNVFSHEISHAYRYYSILSTNHGSVTSSIKKSNSLYFNSKNAHSEDDYEDRVYKMLKRMVYLTDKDEISAFINQTYEQIRQKEYINRGNITRYFDEFRFYRETELLKGLLTIFDRLIMSEKGKNICYRFLSEVYSDRFTGKKAIRMFRQKISKLIDYRVEKFLSVVSKALSDFNRNGGLNENKEELEYFIRSLNIIL